MSSQYTIGRPKDRITARDFLVRGRVSKGKLGKYYYNTYRVDRPHAELPRHNVPARRPAGTLDEYAGVGIAEFYLR